MALQRFKSIWFELLQFIIIIVKLKSMAYLATRTTKLHYPHLNSPAVTAEKVIGEDKMNAKKELL